MASLEYVGNELELFASATNWKSYWSSKVTRYISGSVAEIGAGLGTNTALLATDRVHDWTFVEPDPRMASTLGEKNFFSQSRVPHRVHCGTLADLRQQKFDTIIYIDVLEHIKTDFEEIALAADSLSDGGMLIVLSPAYQFLFSPFDTAIGHFRRYNRRMLADLTDRSLVISSIFYLDSAGLLLSLANKLLLRRNMPTARQIWVWDTYVIPVSRYLDRLLFNEVGKTIIGIWQKKGRED